MSQEQIAGLAFRIQDTGATGGIVVSPLPLQAGAKIVAASQDIAHVLLSADSTTTDYVLFLENTFHGVSLEESVHFQDAFDATVIRTFEPENRSKS